MNDIEKLQLNTDFMFKDIPEELSLSFKMVDVNTLVFPDDLFDQETSCPENDLFDSFLPVIAVPNKNNAYTIIDGCKRYMNCLENRRKKISCRIIQTQLSNFTSGLLRIALNQNRPLHLREKFTVLSWLKKNCTKDTFESTAHKAGFSSKDIEQLTCLFSCEDYIKEALFNGSLDLSLVNSLQVLSGEDQICFLETFKNLKLSFQAQREFLEWLPEIAYVRNLTARNILEEPVVKETIENKTMNAPQQIQKIRTFLYTQKFPRLSNAQKIWKKHATALNPNPACIKFVPNPYFEKDILEVKISITNSQNAVNIFKKLAKISSDEWQKLIYPL